MSQQSSDPNDSLSQRETPAERVDFVGPADDLDSVSVDSGSVGSGSVDAKSDEMDFEVRTGESPAPAVDASNPAGDASSTARDGGSSYEATRVLYRGDEREATQPESSPNDCQTLDGGAGHREADEEVLESDQTVLSQRGSGSHAEISRLSTREIGEALVGTKLQSYELLEFVGGGGMGAVFRAVDTKLERVVAVKVLARSSPNGELAKRFLNEAQSAAQLDHGNIARVYNVDESGGLSYIVFEFVEGENLRDRVAQQGVLSVQQTLQFTLQVTEALDHASQRKVIHRDIKPSNILIAAGGRIKLVDMGLARMSKLESSEADLTASGMTLGTFDYISPEQARDPRRADVRSDLYSLGCTMYFMLTGQPPFPEGNPFEKVHSHREGKRPDPRQLRDDVPAELATLIRRLMAPNPAARFQNPAELIDSLTIVAHQCGFSIAAPHAEQTIARYDRRRRWAHATLPFVVPAIMLLMVGVILELVMGRTSGEPQLVLPTYKESVDASNQETNPDRESASSSDGGENDVPSRSQDRSDGERNNLNSGRDDQTDSGIPAGIASAGGEIGEPNLETDGDSDLVVGMPEEPTMGESLEDMPALDDGSTLSGNVNSELVEFLAVGLPTEYVTDKILAVDSLEMALAEAYRFPNLRSIQLCFSGEQPFRPLEIPIGRWVIEAGEGYQPIVRFDGRNMGVERHVIDVAEANVTWRNIDFLWNVPNRAASTNQTLFRVKQDEELMQQVLRFEDCTLSVRFSDAQETLFRPSLSIFELSTPAPLHEREDARVLDEPPAIQLERCAIRGPVNLLHSPSMTPCRLTWNQGVFISDQRMIHADGNSEGGSAFDFRVTLQNVTVAAAKGIARVLLTADHPESVKLWLSANRCIFLTAEAQSLFEFELLEPTDLGELIRFDGRYPNALPDRKPILSLRFEDDLTAVSDYYIGDAFADGDWYALDLHEPTSAIQWLGAERLRELAVERQTVAGLRMSDDAANLAFENLGLDPLLELEFPSFSPTDRPVAPRPVSPPGEDEVDEAGELEDEAMAPVETL